LNAKENLDSTKGIVISTDPRFVQSMNRLKESSKRLPKEVRLPIAPTKDWLLGWFDCNVTGETLNDLTDKIQARMIEQNKAVVDLFQEFVTVYEVFSALDKGYVQEMRIAINIASRAIQEIRSTNERIIEQQCDISAAQQDIRQLIGHQKQIIQVLKGFKEKLENLKHLYDIDATFNQVHTFQSKIVTLEEASAGCKNNIANIVEVQAGAAKAVESIEIEQKNLKEYVDKHRVGMDLLCSNQQHFSNSLFAAQETVERLSEKLIQTAKMAEQRFSEVERAAERHNANCAEKFSVFEREAKKCEQATQEYYWQTNSALEQLTASSSKQDQIFQNELTLLRSENAMLSKSVLFAKAMSIGSLVVSVIVLILISTGALR